MFQMAMDDGGRRVDNMSIEQCCSRPGEDSPHHRLADLGSTSYVEPMRRHAREMHSVEDKREERQEYGSVQFRPEPNVPDVGGLGWRTKTGHLIKNQAYYIQQPKVNLWDSAVHAGINTWKDWHGPKMRTDAEMMERLDHFDEEEDQWQAKKDFVNTTRVQTLDRFYNRKVNRSMYESSSSWAPHHRAAREVHSCHETFQSSLGEKPEKELKKVFTPFILHKDREAIRQITKRIQNEETWKVVFKQMEQERRQDIRADLQQRQTNTDRLMQMSGQPVVAQDRRLRELPNNCSQRSQELSQPKLVPLPKDVTQLTDFRGLIHADCEHALEALHPGFGHELSVTFRASATRSIEPGWPAPPRPETPVRNSSSPSREAQLKKDGYLIKESIPVSTQRLERIGQRANDDLYMKHSKAQFLPSRAPPPPRQGKSLMQEDYSMHTTMMNASRVSQDFSRTSQSFLPGSPSSKSMGELPPPKRSMVYPVLVSASPSPKAMAMGGSQATTPHSPYSTSMKRFASAPTLSHAGISVRSGGSLRGAKPAVVSICRELDTFEAGAAGVPRISNFFATPRGIQGGSSCSQPVPSIDAVVPKDAAQSQ
ncbi:unnamed protein product [Polarella glacialis]|uniref:Uncharacterized protein n=1 Tax=Polarella glacialis TaxID=89957 RepID=A0A813LQL9_POLGL|nr:unnamed protein product [Polarella glacialis]|mmetsp:Transcript_72372/g.116695  ORF Transcript_72372/g.116695 Transcript_72372/m.116695 type:complete len:595 (-) Transcript_72372:110-1894(-)|eukprot:CAMPEP_0115072616 /NCGR_PEP_ID=MMETSP0227-20121206/14327_1 /TAXON_ID=89957 /ORGANISM="Polarella glacialis, Strain CCMP 1383" /LENGTH=594 /DNA_ID=CAMNT_0002459379 /DNA_START=157 /DNA_END=1941 /DNA_ORIENTATION=+